MGYHPLAIVSSLFFWVYSFVMFYHTISNWKNPNKQDVKFSEIVYGILLIILGFYLLNLFSNAPESSQAKLYGIMIFIFSAIIFWVLVPNILRTYLKVKDNPELCEQRGYAKFLKELNEKYAKADEEATNLNKHDFIKDLSRKFLHILQFTGILVIHFFFIAQESNMVEWGVSPIAWRNFVFFLISSFFFFMLITADLFRITKFEYLPDWAHMWFSKSLEPSRETWTLNSASPILMANMLFIYPGIPFQVLFVAAWVSCVGDAMASLIGKQFGKRKLTHFGCYPNKSYEGLFAGAMTSALGVIILLLIWPIEGLTLPLIIICAILIAVVFIFVDSCVKRITDNILNNILSGLILLAFILLI
jgi:dolichol kinase